MGYSAIQQHTERLLADIQRLYHPEYIFWTNAANYRYAQYLALGVGTAKQFPISGPIARTFVRNVATAVNNHTHIGIKNFLSGVGDDGPTLVYIDAYRHITADELAEGPHYNDDGVELLAKLAADQFA